MGLELGFWVDAGVLLVPGRADRLRVSNLPPFLESPISEHEVLKDWFEYEPPTLVYLDEWLVADRFIEQAEDSEFYGQLLEAGYEDPLQFWLLTRHPFGQVVPKKGVSLFFLNDPLTVSYRPLFVAYSEAQETAFQIWVDSFLDDESRPYDKSYVIHRIEPLTRVWVSL